jgi:hypothetical protein
MRKLSKLSWSAVLVASGLAVLVALVAVALLRAPPTARALDVAPVGELRMVVGTPDGVLVLGERAGYRVDASLAATPLVYPKLPQASGAAEPIHLAEIQSSAWKHGKLALTARVYVNDPDKLEALVMLVDGTRVDRVYTRSLDTKRAHVSNVLAIEPELDDPKDALFAVYAQEDGSVYRLAFSRGFAKDEDDARQRLDPEFWPDSVERIVWQAGEGPIFLCADRKRTLDEDTAPLVPTTPLDLFGYQRPRPVIPPAEKDVIARVIQNDALAPYAGAPALGGKRAVTAGGRVVASLAEPDSMLAVPMAGRWLLIGREHGARLMLDGSGARVDRVPRLATLRRLAEDPSPAWLALAGLLVGALVALFALLARALSQNDLARVVAPERAEPGARGVFFGTLHVPEGVMIEEGARGHLEIPAGCRVRLGAVDVDLGAGLTRADTPSTVPLIDGDAVFLIGKLDSDAGGPHRSSGRLKLTADGRHHAIGRGVENDYAHRISAGRNQHVLRIALINIALEIALLARFAYDVFL